MKDIMQMLGICFAGGGGGEPQKEEAPNVEVDNVDIPDSEDDEDEELDLSHLFEDEEETEEEDEEETEETEEEETEETEEEKPVEEPEERKFTQAEVDRMIKDRLARKDRQYREEYGKVNQKLTQLEQLTGMNVDAITTHIRQAQVKARSDEWGISEDEAHKILENEQKAQIMEQKLRAQEQQNEQTQRIVQYDRDKQKLISKYPQAKQYENEIDEFAQNGAALGFEPAMKYVLGQAILEGKIDVEKDVEQKVLASTQRKAKIKPEKAGSGGGAEGTTEALTKQEKQLARNLGLSTKEYLASKKKLEKQKKARGN